MRVLMCSNYFPPYARGGYEQWCAEVAIELRKRGHEVHIITGVEQREAGSAYQGLPVRRVLSLEAQEGTWETARRFFFRRRKLEQETLDQVRQVIGQVKPDAAFVWGMWNVPRTVPALIEQCLPQRVIYYICDYWLTLPSAYEQYWRTPSGRPTVRVAKQVVAQIAIRQMAAEPRSVLKLERCLCVSHAVRHNLQQSGVSMQSVEVVHGGTQVEEFTPAYASRTWGNTPLRLLYAGRITTDKGVHTVVEGIGRLPAGAVVLTICGNSNSAYGESLRRLAREQDRSEYVTFKDQLPRAEIPSLMAQHDVLVFPSVWEEPFARLVLEGMAAGLVVVGTTTGGTGEILADNETGLTFPVEDADAFASQIQRLLSDSDLQRKLAVAGHRLVAERFTFQHMVDALETELRLLAES